MTKPKAKQGPTTQGAQVFDQCVLLDLTFTRWGTQRKVRAGEVDVKAASDGADVSCEAVRLTKRILDCEQYDVIGSNDGVFRKRIGQLGLPFRRGLYAIPIALVERVVGLLEKRGDQRSEEIDALMAVYRSEQEKAKESLGPLWSENDYPDPEDVEWEFQMVWSFVELTAPGNLRKVNPGLYAAEGRKIREQWEQAAQQIQAAMREVFAKLVSSLRERLDGEVGKDGKLKGFRDARVEQLRDWVSLFDARNVVGDADLAAVVKQAQAVLDGVSADELKVQPRLREQVGATLKAIETSARSLVVADAPRRRFRLDADD